MRVRGERETVARGREPPWRPCCSRRTLAAAPELWVATQGLESPACDSAAFADAVRAQRPGVFVRPWLAEAGSESPPASAVRVRLSPGNGATLLEITGAGSPVVRPRPAEDGCKRHIEVAALIVDGALDDLRMSQSAPPVDSLAAPIPLRKRMEVGAALGAGVEQGALGFRGELRRGGSRPLPVRGADARRRCELAVERLCQRWGAAGSGQDDGERRHRNFSLHRAWPWDRAPRRPEPHIGGSVAGRGGVDRVRGRRSRYPLPAGVPNRDGALRRPPARLRRRLAARTLRRSACRGTSGANAHDLRRRRSSP